MPPRPGVVPRLEFAIPCRRFDNQEVDGGIEGILEAAELRKPGRLLFQLAVKVFATVGQHQLVVSPISPKGTPEANGLSTLDFTVENPAFGERLAVPINFPCEYVGWWVLEVAVDGQKLGDTHLWIQFVPY